MADQILPNGQRDTDAPSRPSPVDSRTYSRISDDIKPEVLVNYLYQEQCSRFWTTDGSGDVEGVVLRTRGEYLTCPSQLAESPFAKACATLKLKCAMTVNTRVIRTALQWLPGEEVPLINGMKVQVLSTIKDLACAKKQQNAAFIASAGLLIVWDDEPLHLLNRARSIESELMELVWKSQGSDEETGEETEEKSGSAD